MKKSPTWKKIKASFGTPLARIILVIGLISTIVAIWVEFNSILETNEENMIKKEAEKIRAIIEQEACCVVDGRIIDAVDLFAEDAYVRDASGGEVWSGNSIIERYLNLPEFVYLKHDAVVFQDVDNTCAEVIADTVGTYYVNGTTVDISSNQGEKWTFKKINGEWKITGFTYNLP